jgi:Protein of unknown function DUF2617
VIDSSTAISPASGPVLLSVPYRNARAADLSWSLDVPDQAALHIERHTIGMLTVEVRILGASHQILVRRGTEVDQPVGTAANELICRETIACKEGFAGVLPEAEERELADGYRYEVRCGLRTLALGDFSASARALRSYADHRPGATVAVFPEIPDAVTAVAVEPLPTGLRGLLWRTWHTYPDPGGTGEVVATRTVLYRPVLHTPL